MHCDCLILGGGPAASTIGSLLKRYKPELDVLIVEREKFPRDHIGESHLPVVMSILGEMGVYDKVEAQNFPIKIGSTYRWGIRNEPWTLNFLEEPVRNVGRPLPLEGQRYNVSFHVDRGIYDKILLDHCAELGCQVFEQAKATKVHRDGDRVTGVDIVRNDRPEPVEMHVTAKYYIDATGASGTLRRAMGVEAEYPTALKNIAIWDYWQGAKWAVHEGELATRVQIMSVGWGWLWFIPISATRTSIGLVTHAGYYKSSGKSTEELYLEAIAASETISELVAPATREGKVSATKDWSYVSERLAGENWLLAGDACGFADPILSAGISLAQVSGRKVAYTILELERGEHDAEWLKQEFNRAHRFNIMQHHRFAEFWYAGNGCAKDLKEYCSEIAQHAGITLDAETAFFWMSTGGFTAGNMPDVRSTNFGLTGISAIASKIFGIENKWRIQDYNLFTLDLEGSTQETVGYYSEGTVTPTPAYRKGEKLLPLPPKMRFVFSMIEKEQEGACLLEQFKNVVRRLRQPPATVFYMLEILESLVHEGWVKAEYDPERPPMDFEPISIFK